MVKRKAHLRRINNKLVLVGRGKKNPLIGKLVVYEGGIYTVSGVDRNGLLTLRNLTSRLRVERVPRNKTRLYK